MFRNTLRSVVSCENEEDLVDRGVIMSVTALKSAGGCLQEVAKRIKLLREANIGEV
jgi:hypothetical protein